jgi:hypothetical protein
MVDGLVGHGPELDRTAMEIQEQLLAREIAKYAVARGERYRD